MVSEEIRNNNVVDICKNAKHASRVLAASSGKQRNMAIRLMKDKLTTIQSEIFKANEADVKDAEEAGLSPPLVKRLTINEKVFAYMIKRITSLVDLEDPCGRILSGYTNKDGLMVQKISVPLGVIALIYESRPNVTTDAASVCLKSGNAVILRGGSEAFRTNILLTGAMQDAVKESGLPPESIQIIKQKEHAIVSELLAMDEYIDVIIPRGGKDLIKKIAEGTRIPVIKHYEGICHLYIADDAPVNWSVDLCINSKCQSVEVCNALETVLIDEKAVNRVIHPLFAALKEKQVEIRGCEKIKKIFPDVAAAREEDWSTEYLAPILSIKIVENKEEAVSHINSYGSGHTDGIITMDLETAHYFVSMVDSASVLVNTSTRLSGGGAYGLGSVVGISTDKLHARGPVGPFDLTSYKWVAYGRGHIRE
ncbi:MAG: glutamate-5-semialdehyde dehydrogenase [Spirochaetales bacterium]|nr:glutamate-5-semialdehyde dehydrogenase [Spirochaetales bacterium]